MGELLRVGKYQIVTMIGKGGMGSVYKAFDPMIKRHVALKIMNETSFEDETARARFLREAQAIGKLQHPNIIALFDAGEHEGRPFLVVEYLEGRDFKQLLIEKAIPPAATLLTLLVDVCEALDYSHQHGIIHRDIKPANIFLLDDGSVRLMDFGVAKVENLTLTQAGTVLGTVQYMSPEQIQGKQIDHRSDLFSMGIVLHELFSTQRPFSGSSFNSLVTKILFSEPEPFTPSDSSVPDALKAVIAKAMTKDKDRRYQTAAELALDLTKVKMILNQQMIARRKVRQDTKAVSAKPPVVSPSRQVAGPQPAEELKTGVLVTSHSQVSPSSHVFRTVARWLFLGILTMVGVGGSVLLIKSKFGLTSIAPSSPTPASESALSATMAEADRPAATPTPTPQPVGLVTPMESPVNGQHGSTTPAETRETNEPAKTPVTVGRTATTKPIDPEATVLSDKAKREVDARVAGQDEIEQLYNEGLRAWNRGDAQATLFAMNKVLALSPGHAQAKDYKAKAETAAAVNRSPTAPRETATKPANSASDGLDLLKLQGQHAFIKGQYETCIGMMNKILAQDPANTFALDLKGQAEARLRGDSRTVSLNQELADLKLAYDKGMDSQAGEAAARILAVDPTNQIALDYKEKLARRQAESLRAQRTRNDAIEQVKRLVQRGDYTSALQASEQLRKEYPDDADVARVVEEVQQSYQNSLRSNPTPLPVVVIAHSPGASILAGKKLSLSMTFSGYTKAVVVTLTYRATRTPTWKKLTMTPENLAHRGVIPGDDVQLPAMEYFFTIQTADGVTIYSGDKQPFRIKVIQESPGTVPVF